MTTSQQNPLASPPPRGVMDVLPNQVSLSGKNPNRNPQHYMKRVVRSVGKARGILSNHDPLVDGPYSPPAPIDAPEPEESEQEDLTSVLGDAAPPILPGVMNLCRNTVAFPAKVEKVIRTVVGSVPLLPNASRWTSEFRQHMVEAVSNLLRDEEWIHRQTRVLYSLTPSWTDRRAAHIIAMYAVFASMMATSADSVADDGGGNPEGMIPEYLVEDMTEALTRIRDDVKDIRNARKVASEALHGETQHTGE